MMTHTHETQPEITNKLARLLKISMISIFTGRKKSIEKPPYHEKPNAEPRNLQETATDFIHRIESEAVDTNEMFIQIVQPIVEELRQMTGDPTLAIIILGSGTHFGIRVRELTNNPGADLDWMLLSRRELLPDERKKITDYVKQRIPQVAKIFRPGSDIKSCFFYNSDLFVIEPFLNTLELTKLILNNCGTSDINRIVVLLHTIVPDNIASEQKEIILEALSAVYKQNPDIHEDICRKLIDLWKKNHQIKIKHFLNESMLNSQIVTHYNRDPQILEIISHLLKSDSIVKFTVKKFFNTDALYSPKVKWEEITERIITVLKPAEQLSRDQIKILTKFMKRYIQSLDTLETVNSHMQIPFVQMLESTKVSN